MDDRPFVTVVMPVRNEGRFLGQTLDSVIGQDYPKSRLEILVADGMSSDGTAAIVRGLADRSPVRIRCLENPKRIAAAGLNAAIREAAGDIIVRVDGHTRLAPDYVRACVEELSRTGADNVGGRAIPEGNGIWGETIALATGCRFGVGTARFRKATREEWVDSVSFGAWPRRVFDKVGYFDEEFVRNQDDEFNYRLNEKGGKVLLSPRLCFFYIPRSSLGALGRQYFDYGFWKVRVFQKHPRQLRPRHLAPPLFAGGLMTLAVAGIFFPWVRPWLAVPALLYLALNLAFSLRLACCYGLRYLFALPFVFGVLHGSYGLGFLLGLAHFTVKCHA